MAALVLDHAAGEAKAKSLHHVPHSWQKRLRRDECTPLVWVRTRIGSSTAVNRAILERTKYSCDSSSLCYVMLVPGRQGTCRGRNSATKWK